MRRRSTASAESINLAWNINDAKQLVGWLLAVQIVAFYENIRFSLMARLVFLPSSIAYYVFVLRRRQYAFMLCSRALFSRKRCFCSLWILNTTLWSWITGYTASWLDVGAAVHEFRSYVFTSHTEYRQWTGMHQRMERMQRSRRRRKMPKL